MDLRSYGETQNCKGCRFWSEMVARARGEKVEALCLNQHSPNSLKYVTATVTCDAWASGHLGAIDEPGAVGADGPYGEGDGA